jgi:hypothetical protein
MTIVAGFDVHRAQITFDALDRETGELHRGRIAATPEGVRRWVGRFPDEEIHVAVEAGTGWLFVCEALCATGAAPHLAEPAETSARRGKKRRAKTDREDARWLRTLLAEGRLPEAWIPPAHGREWRTRTACARHWSTSARPGLCESKRRSSTTASRACRTSCSGARGATSSMGLSCPPRPGSGSKSRWR